MPPTAGMIVRIGEILWDLLPSGRQLLGRDRRHPCRRHAPERLAFPGLRNDPPRMDVGSFVKFEFRMDHSYSFPARR